MPRAVSSTSSSFAGTGNVFPSGTFVDAAKIAQVRIAAQASQSLTPEERWVQRELGFYEDSYTQTEGITALFVTFNVGCKKPASDLSALVKKTMPDGVTPVDLIAVGLQEVDMSAAAMLKEETEAAFPWITALQALVGADQNPASTALPYLLYPPKQLVGLLLLVFVRKVVVPHFTECSISTVATGALGSVGNKGGVGFRFRVHQTSICIVTCHLAAGQKSSPKRNEDISSILSTMDFNVGSRQISLSSNAVLQDQSTFVAVPELLPKDHDIVAVIGDLNYRVELPYETAVPLANAKDISALLKEDQLVKEMRNPHTPWKGFIDCTPTFPPTYRFDIGTNTYDTSEKQRIPAFTDRILFWNRKSRKNVSVQVKQLDSVPEVLSSDHKPVRAFSIVPVKVLVKEQREQVTKTLRERVAKVGLDRVASAKTTLSSSSVTFGSLPIGRGRGSATVTITNVGECVATVHAFRQVDGDTSECLWLRVFPLTANILPGDSAELVVECSLDFSALDWVRRWLPYEGNGHVSVKSMLVLRVDDGPVHFVECALDVQPSAFGNSLDNVLRLESAPCVEAYKRSTRRSGGTDDSVPSTLRMPRPWLPKELWYMCDAIFRRGAKEPGLFGADAGGDEDNDDATDEVIQFLDTHAEPLPDNLSVKGIAKALISFFALLQQPLIPYNLYSAALSAARTGGRVPLYFVQQQLPPQNGNVWLYLMSFLNFLLKPSNQSHNQLTAQFLADVFSGCVFRRSTAGGTDVGGGVASTTGAVGQETAMLKQQAQIRQQLQQERSDAAQLILFFLQPSTSLLS